MREGLCVLIQGTLGTSPRRNGKSLELVGVARRFTMFESFLAWSRHDSVSQVQVSRVSEWRSVLLLTSGFRMIPFHK